MASISDLSFDDLIPGNGVDPALLAEIERQKKLPQQQIRPSKWNLQETRTPLEILQAEQADQQSKAKPSAPPIQSLSFDDLIPGQKPSADANLGGSLQLGIPFTNKRFDTGIPLPASVESGIVGAGKTTARLLQGVNPFTKAGDVAEENRLYKPLADAHPLATTVGEIAPYLMTGNPLASAAMAGAEYGTPEERAMRAGLAFGGAKVGQGVARMFGPKSMAGIPNTAADFLDYGASQGNKWGIPLRMAQTTDSKPVQIIDAVAANLPVSSGVIAKAKDASYQGFNRAVGQTFGADTTRITPELLGQSQKDIGGKIGSLAERNTLVPDYRLAQDLAAVGTRAQKNLGTDDAKIVDNWIQELLSKQQQSGGIPGTNYRAWRSDVGELAKSSGGTLGNILGDLRQSVTKAMDRSISPQDAEAWAKANKQYFNVKQVADAQAATPGSLSPTQLLQAVNRNQKNARYGGGNDLAELAQWAKPTLGDAIPNSGTAQREWYQKIMTSPLTTIGTVGGGLYGADKMGLSPVDTGLGLLGARGAARFMAGQPASELMRRLLMNGGVGGGLLGYEAANR